MQGYKDILCEKKTWLITGVAGFIGSHLLETLLKYNQKVIGLDNFLTGKKDNLDEVLSSFSEETKKNFTFYEGDIRDFKMCQEVTKGVDYVLHQAGLASIPRSLKDPITTNEVNVTGFLNILRAAQENEVTRFVYASSSSVYGDSPDLPKVEDTIGNLLSPYATSKRTNELYGQVFFRTYGIPTIGLRYFNVFGPRQDPQSLYSAVIPIWVNSLLKNEACLINGDGLNSRDFCYVDDVVQANIKAALITRKEAYGEIFNISYGKRTNLLELYALIQSNLLVKEKQPGHRDARPGDIKHSLASIEKAKNLLSYHPNYTIQQGLKITIDWYSNQLRFNT